MEEGLDLICPEPEEHISYWWWCDGNAMIQAMYDDCDLIPIYSNARGFIVSQKVHDTGIFSFVDYSLWSPENAWLSK